MIRQILATLLAAALLASISGCNAIEGAGKDIKRAGKVISDEAKQIKNRM